MFNVNLNCVVGLINAKKAVEPYLEKLKMSKLTDEQQGILSVLEANIREIVSPFVRELSSAYLDLTSTEIQVADLIKQGKATKEIAALLNMSRNTVMTHRFKIRSKLGLLKTGTSLYTFLQSQRWQ
jgi:DNA-binding NarL/FixJ family response regulator